MKNTLLVIACAALLTVGAVPRRPAPGAAMPITGLLTFSGKGTDGRTFAINQQVTLTVTDAPPIPIPPPTPGTVTITSVVAASGQPLTSAAGGSIVYVKGAGFGAGGTVRIANQACAVLDWLPYQVSCKTPVVPTSLTGPVVVSPTGAQPATSAFSFTIAGSGPLPPPVPVPVPTPTPVPVTTPRVLLQWPQGSGIWWPEGHLHPSIYGGPTYGPLSTWSFHSATGVYPDPWAPPYGPTENRSVPTP